VLPKIKGVFTGKVVVKIAGMQQELVDTAQAYAGYDYIGTS